MLLHKGMNFGDVHVRPVTLSVLLNSMTPLQLFRGKIDDVSCKKLDGYWQFKVLIFMENLFLFLYVKMNFGDVCDALTLFLVFSQIS